MKRRSRHQYKGNAFPSIRELPDRRQVLAGLAVLAGGASLPLFTIGCGGVDMYVDDYMGLAVLPAPPDSRHLIFNNGSTLEYRVDLVLGDEWMHDCLTPDSSGGGSSSISDVMESLDTVLRNHEADEFQDGEDLSVIEAELAHAIHARCGTGSETWRNILSLDLLVDAVHLTDVLPTP